MNVYLNVSFFGNFTKFFETKQKNKKIKNVKQRSKKEKNNTRMKKNKKSTCLALQQN